jgi:hypothetical protein
VRLVRLIHGYGEHSTMSEVPRCVVCGDGDALAELNCGHRTCYDCVETWLCVLIRDEGTTLRKLTCPICLTALHPHEASALIRNQTLLAACERRTLEAALGTMVDFRWCQRCPLGGLLPLDPACNDVYCECGASQCRYCSHSIAGHAIRRLAGAEEVAMQALCAVRAPRIDVRRVPRVRRSQVHGLGDRPHKDVRFLSRADREERRLQ